MNASISKFDRESICVTCLSQDRKLFPVSDVPTCAKFYSELSLAWTDKVCWECHHLVRKLVLFKNKAQKAQAWLQNISTGQQSQISCLSSLGTSTGIFLNVTDPGLTTTTAEVDPLLSVKQEVLDEDDEGAGDDVTKVDETKIKEETVQIEIEIPALVPRKRKHKSPPRNAPVQTPDIYKEEILTEDGLSEWWQRKRGMKFFTQSIPDERCDKCVQPFDGARAAEVHAQKHTEMHGDVECDLCHLRLADERELEFHQKLHYRLLKCSYCEFTWDDVNAMRQHCSDQHNIEQTVWDCEPCRRQFSALKKYTAHVSRHRRTKCPECGKVLNESCLKLHMIQHRGGKPLLRCAECGGRYRGEEGMRTHMETHSKEVDPAAFCTDCNIQFRTMYKYRVHMRYTARHSSDTDKWYKCKVCNLKFRRKAGLRLHSAIHTEATHPCDQCDKLYKTERSLRFHKKKHEMKERARDKLCDHCGKGFYSKTQLSEHINTHTGARPFVCKLCGADFGHKSALYLHGRYKHKIPKKNDARNSGKGESGEAKGKYKEETEKVHIENTG